MNKERRWDSSHLLESLSHDSSSPPVTRNFLALSQTQKAAFTLGSPTDTAHMLGMPHRELSDSVSTVLQL